ncbi:hypothetical protein MBLNU230_g3540t1 [Neophaeotheca triangularis]
MPRTRSSLSAFSRTLFRYLFLPTLIAAVWLYLYPIIHGCSFPSASTNYDGNQTAPFRLLALGDPQLEGDSSLPAPNAPAFPSLRGFLNGRKDWSSVARDVLLKDIPKLAQGYRKQLDLWGNDYYLAHIYRHVRWWTQPTHTIVLGDLLGSQWIDDDEFEWRARRFWGRTFAGGVKVPDDIMEEEGRTEALGNDKEWEDRIMVIPGNHDIGYAGDINQGRVERFERVFGRMNWDITFTLNSSLSGPSLHLVLLNSMNLDSPAFSRSLQDQTQAFLSRQLSTPASSPNHATVLLTHIPLHKPAGICTDAPFFDYFPSWNGGGIKEQNHLSEETSKDLLDRLLSTAAERSLHNDWCETCYSNSIYYPSRPKAIILNGHDHEGCDSFHHLVSDPATTRPGWETIPHTLSHLSYAVRALGTQPWLREITVRSMMGQYGGNAGMLSAWWEGDVDLNATGAPGLRKGGWRFEYSTCELGVQHWWWGTHTLVVIEVALGAVWVLAKLLDALGGGKERIRQGRKEKRG